jgi:hypothetical protein
VDLFSLSSEFSQLRVDLRMEGFWRVFQCCSQLLNALQDALPDTAFSINDHALLPRLARQPFYKGENWAFAVLWTLTQKSGPPGKERAALTALVHDDAS